MALSGIANQSELAPLMNVTVGDTRIVGVKKNQKQIGVVSENFNSVSDLFC